mmetsp:Transcript_19216/g.23380  ORF Transcript_19216/g.23380 Transcript_19216/m.23380 type:complete len:123 (+) Transcript_19216:1015-1383(+)
MAEKKTLRKEQNKLQAMIKVRQINKRKRLQLMMTKQGTNKKRKTSYKEFRSKLSLCCFCYLIRACRTKSVQLINIMINIFKVHQVDILISLHTAQDDHDGLLYQKILLPLATSQQCYLYATF